MTSYSQIYELEKKLYDTLADFQSIVNDSDFKEIFNNAGRYIIESHKPVDFRRAQCDIIITRLYTYAVNKISRQNALKMILTEFNCVEPVYISRLCGEIYAEIKKNNMPSKVYAAHMLHRAGVSNKKIAALLGVSSVTAARYLKLKLMIS